MRTGSATWATATPAPASSVPANSHTTLSRLRMARPTAVAASPSHRMRSTAVRRASHGASGATTPRHRTGPVVSSPDPVPERRRSAPPASSSGGGLAKVVRRLSERRMTAAAAASPLRWRSLIAAPLPTGAPAGSSFHRWTSRARRHPLTPVPARPARHAVGVTRTAPFLQDIPVADAQAAWRAVLGDRRTESVGVPVTEALGRVTAAPVWARRSSPAYDAAAMDGIAVRAADTLGAMETAPLRIERYAVVDTGDAMPSDFDAVVMREHVHWTDAGPELRASVAPWQHVRSIGEDVAATELLLPEGHRLPPVAPGAAAAAGHTTLEVRRPPRLAILPTGDEVRPVGADTVPGELVDTNSLMLAAQALKAGCEGVVGPILPDDPERLRAAVEAAAGETDLVIVIAGSSAGRDDHTA